MMTRKRCAVKWAALVLALGLGQASAEGPADLPRGPVPSPKGDGSIMNPMRRMRHEQRLKAALRAHQRRKENEAAGRVAPQPKAKAAQPKKGQGGGSGLQGAAAVLMRMAVAQVGTPDIYAVGNYANSKLPVATCVDSAGVVMTGATCQRDSDCPGYAPPFLVGVNQFAGGSTCTGPVVASGIRKFVDTLAPLCPLGVNNLGNCLPVAVPTVQADGSEYYEIGLRDYVHRWHTDLPAGAKTRGYYQKNAPAGEPGGQNHYLGPVIVAKTNVPVRVKFTNELGLGTAGDLFLPVDKDISGTGVGPDGLTRYTQNRATLHLHGGNTPWISDGTQHQWTVPFGETGYRGACSVSATTSCLVDADCPALETCLGATPFPAGAKGFKKGLTAKDVPDMPPTGDGDLTFYWTNQQSGRLMFYHDHAYGITRLNVYAGEAAGYLLVNPPDEDALAAVGVPGTVGSSAATTDLAHMIPLVIQDRTFVPPATAAAPAPLTVGNALVARASATDTAPAPTVAVGNPLIARASPTDTATNVLVIINAPLPAGTIQSLEAFNQVGLAGNSAGKVFNAYVLRPGAAGQYAVVHDSGPLTVPAPTDPANGNVHSYPVPGWAVNAGDLVAFYGAGIPLDIGAGTDTLAYPSPLAPAQGSTITVAIGDPNYPIFIDPGTGLPQARTYSFSATVTPATALAPILVVLPTPLPAGTLQSFQTFNQVTGGVSAGNVFHAYVLRPTAVAGQYAVVYDSGLLTVPPTATDTVQSFPANVAVSYGDRVAFYGKGIPLDIGTGADVLAYPAPAAPVQGATIDVSATSASFPVFAQPRTYSFGAVVAPPGNVPQLAWQDPTWDTVKWGPEDALWFPHVYLPNQWPDNPDLSNTNPVGRWDYGPWFHPAQTTLTGVDSFGLAYSRPLLKPCTSVAAVTAANPSGATQCPTTPDVSLVPEAFMDTPVVNGVAYPKLTVEPRAYRFQILNAANERNFNLSFFVADATGTEVTMADAVLHTPTSAVPLCRPTDPVDPVTGLQKHVGATCWPAAWPTDGRQGGAADPAHAGPKWVQIGSEAGILPAPAVIPAQAVAYEQNKRNIVVLNVAAKSLFMGPAERADVLVDFSAFAGKTLILYNDAPAPVPAGDPRQDYYTGMPDFTLNGGSPTVLPGYGPNVRTIMQINVVGTPVPAPYLDPAGAPTAALTSALGARFAASQPKPVVPEAAYNAVYNPATPYTNNYFPITLSGGTPITFTPVGSATPATVILENKALHELFTTDFGRMNSLLGVEVPFTSWLNQTTIPFTNFDPTTEFLPDNQPQIWRITHNGVDTHTIHFHLFTAQVVNRVGWDGQIRPPDANELGWKESVRMNPLEDVYIALQPVRQTLPWPLPDMIRPLDVDRCVAGTPGCTGNSQFTGVDIHNRPIVVRNTLANFGWEYVWHCHLLGHEEEDMLRAEVFVVAPEAPSNLTAVPAAVGRTITLTWNDNSLSALSFNVQRATDAAFTTNVQNFSVAATGAKTYTFADTPVPTDALLYYQVNAAKTLTSPARPGESFSAASAWSPSASAQVVSAVTVAPAALTFTSTVNVRTANQVVTVTNKSVAPVTGLTRVLTSVPANQFQMASSTCGATLAAGASCTISVNFRPTTLGNKTGTLTVSFNGGAGSPQTVALTGIVQAPVLTLTPTSIAFGGQTRGTQSAPRPVTVANTGTAPLIINGVSLTGTNPGQFTQTNVNCPIGGAGLAAGASCTVNVAFAPTRGTTLGVKSANLRVAVAAPATTGNVALTGTAQ